MKTPPLIFWKLEELLDNLGIIAVDAHHLFGYGCTRYTDVSQILEDVDLRLKEKCRAFSRNNAYHRVV